jgi:uncharacterized MAPEG superfamily protein
MTIDLWMLAAAVGLTWLLIVGSATPGIVKDLKWAAGNRDTPLEMAPWVNRAHRTAQNMKENLPLFAILVLIAHVSGSANETSALGAEIFLGARLVHAGIYIAGVPYVRTLVWTVSVAGMMIIASTFF